MKAFLFFILFLKLVLTSIAQNDITPVSFPTNFSSSDFEKIKKRQGDIIAFDGVIREHKASPKNTPIYFLELDENKKIWTALMFENKINKIGDSIRVIGTLEKIKDIGLLGRYLDNEKYIVVIFGLVDLVNDNIVILPGTDNLINEWINGTVPSDDY